MVEHVDLFVVNVVCIMEVVNKNTIKLDDLRSLGKGEEPVSFSIPDPNAPWLMAFPKIGLEIHIMDNRLQIQAKGGSSYEKDFGKTIKVVLNAFGDQPIRAFGFNFVADVESEDVMTIFGIKNKLQNNKCFKVLPETSLRVAYKTNLEDTDVRCEFSLSDGMPLNRVQVNIHLDKPATTLNHELIANYFNESKALAYGLIQELT